MSRAKKDDKGVKAMARRRVNLERLLEEEKRLMEQLAKKRQKLLQLKRKLQKEYRKREASFLIGIGRTLLKYGKVAELKSGKKVIVLPIDNRQLREAFIEYNDVVNLNDDFKKWIEVLEEVNRKEEKGDNGKASNN